MPLTKEDMINSIRGRCGLPKSTCAELVDGVFETIKKTLESGEDVRISGFGKFSVRNQNKRRVRNPATGEAVILDARRVVTFKCASGFKERLRVEFGGTCSTVRGGQTATMATERSTK